MHYIALFHPIGEKIKTRVDFDSEITETSVFDLIWQEGYKIYQFILPEYLYNLPIEALNERNAKFELFRKERSTWFGLSSEIEQEILLFPQSGFYYPYSYGSYFYLYSKEDIEGKEFMDWLNQHFPERFSDFDDTYAGINSDSIKLLHDSDYILVTNYDYQNEFGITAKKEICDILSKRLEAANLENFQIEQYIQPKE